MKEQINEYRKFLIDRIGYFRVKAGLSARDLSLRIGKSNAYIAKFEQGQINMPSELLLDALKVLNVSPDEFFSLDPKTYHENKDLLVKINSLTVEGKELIVRLIERMK